MKKFIAKVKPQTAEKTDPQLVLADEERKLLNAYKAYYERTSVYHGSYPSWKVLQEFRELINAYQADMTEVQKYHFAALDGYLNRLYEEAEKVKKEIRGHGDPRLETEDLTKSATGENFLEEIISRQSDLKKPLSKYSSKQAEDPETD